MVAQERNNSTHATCVSFGSHGVLITGPSGSGKSDLALRLITQTMALPGVPSPAVLVADDRVYLSGRDGNTLVAACPDELFGLIEVRGIGIMKVPAVRATTIRLHIGLVEAGDVIDRHPGAPETFSFARVTVPSIMLRAVEASAPAKVLVALVVALDAKQIATTKTSADQ